MEQEPIFQGFQKHLILWDRSDHKAIIIVTLWKPSVT